MIFSIDFFEIFCYDCVEYLLFMFYWCFMSLFRYLCVLWAFVLVSGIFSCVMFVGLKLRFIYFYDISKWCCFWVFFLFYCFMLNVFFVLFIYSVFKVFLSCIWGYICFLLVFMIRFHLDFFFSYFWFVLWVLCYLVLSHFCFFLYVFFCIPADGRFSVFIRYVFFCMFFCEVSLMMCSFCMHLVW